MALLDANMGLLEEASTNSTRPPPTPATSLEHHSIESGSIASESTDHYSFTNAHLPSAGDFHSPSQFSFDTPFYSGQHHDDTSPAAYGAAGNVDAQPQDFGFGGNGNAGLWSY